MTRLGLTQRVEVVESYGERRDCLDQEWTVLLEEQGFQPVPLPNQVGNIEAYLDSLSLDGIVLTSGNDLASLDEPADPAPERDNFEQAALDYALTEGLPVLGVCRGLEFLTVAFGGSLSPVDDHIAEDHIVTFDDDIQPIKGITLPKEQTVNSYHDFGIHPEDVPNELTILGHAEDGTVECVMHDSQPIVGIMWHPERESPSENLDRQIFTGLFRDDEQ